ncbi:MAG: NfeD family protein [Betaproteobacteria bacterium]|nr:NfeD family protein [Betaproteobacteria bacterium]
MLVLPAFWIWPVQIALPVWGAAAAVAATVYVFAYKAWKMPLANGPQTLLGAIGRVISVGERGVTLRVRGELWRADIEGAPLSVDEEAVIEAIEGLRLTVRGLKSPTAGKPPPRISATPTSPK